MEVLTRPAAPPRLIRLFHRWGERSAESGADTLREAVALAGDGPSLLVTGAGFVWTRLSEPTAERHPDPDEFKAITEAAHRAAEAVARGLPGHRPDIVLGVDVLAACERSDAERQVGQFAALLPAAGGLEVLMPKRYPTPAEQAYLRVPDGPGAPSPACDTPAGRAAVLVCHDVNAFSPRGRATTTYQARADWRSVFLGAISAATPLFALHLVHEMKKDSSFRQAYSAWMAEVGVPLFGVSALSSDPDADEPADLAKALLGGTDGWPVMDLRELAPGGAL